MGGDEFCALFAPTNEVAEPIIRGAARALTEHGEGFSVTCSYGAIVLPREAQNATEALRIADQRMYAQKNAGRSSATRQSKDVLVRALAESNPESRCTSRASPSLPSELRAASGCRATRSTGSVTPPSSTTSAKSRSPTPSSTSQVSSSRSSGSSSAGTR